MKEMDPDILNLQNGGTKVVIVIYVARNQGTCYTKFQKKQMRD